MTVTDPRRGDLFGLPRESGRVGYEDGADVGGQLTLFEPDAIGIAATRPAGVGANKADAWRWVRPRPSRPGGAGAGATTTGHLLRRRRVASDVTQADLAGRLRITQSIVSRVEAGRIALTLDDLCEWAAALDSDPVTLLGDEVEGPRTEIRRPRDRSLRVSTRFAGSVPPTAVDDVASVGVSVRRLVLAQRSRAPLLPAEARALIRAGFADGSVLRSGSPQPSERDTASLPSTAIEEGVGHRVRRSVT